MEMGKLLWLRRYDFRAVFLLINSFIKECHNYQKLSGKES